MYTDFSTGAQFLFVMIECLVNMHACTFVETQGAGQVLRIHAQSHFVFAASIEFVERVTQEGKPEATFAPWDDELLLSSTQPLSDRNRKSGGID